MARTRGLRVIWACPLGYVWKTHRWKVDQQICRARRESGKLLGCLDCPGPIKYLKASK